MKNNIATFEALILSIELAHEVEARSVKVYSDSQLTVKQVNVRYKVRHQSMIKYLAKAKQVIK